MGVSQLREREVRTEKELSELGRITGTLILGYKLRGSKIRT